MNNIERRAYGAPTQSTRRNVLIVGPSGGGKSAVINALVQRSVAPSRLGPVHVTTEHIVQIAGIYYSSVNITLDFYDTRGFMDNQLSFAELSPAWNAMVNDHLAKVDFVLVVLPIDRSSASMTSELSKMVARLREWGMQEAHVIVLLNRRDLLTDEEVTRFTAEFRSTESIPSILRAEATRVIPTCFIDLQMVIPSGQAALRPRIESSITAVLDELLRTAETSPFHPRAVIQLEDVRRRDVQVRGFMWFGFLYPLLCALHTTIFGKN